MFLDIKILITALPVFGLVMLLLIILEVYFDQYWTHEVAFYLMPLFFLYLGAEFAWCVFRGVWL